MQNKGFVKVFALLLTLVCLFYLSFSFVTGYHMDQAANDPKGEQHYLDSMQNEKVWLGVYTLKQSREMEIGLGLDLKGGMYVIMEVSVPDIIKALADHKSDVAFNQAVEAARVASITSQSDYITLFVDEYKKLAPEGSLAAIFATQQLKDKVNTRSTDSEVVAVLRSEVQAAIDNSFNVLRTRIDRFGVVQPNIQTLEGSMGRIMIELPGVKEPERVRKLLQGSANLEFWDTYNASEIVPALMTADAKLAAVAQAAEPVAEEAATEAEAPSKEDVAVDDIEAAITGENAAEENVDVEALKKQHPLLSRLQPVQANAVGSVIGYAHYNDTAAINALIATPEFKSVMPRELRLYWGVEAIDRETTNQIYELYAIKCVQRNGRAPIEGDVVVDATDTFDQHGRPCVTMAMNSDGARRWAQLTKANINKAIAIVLDGYVYSAPMVSNEITGGRSEIKGNFTIETTKDLANVLRSGKMPAPARIVQEDIVGPSLGQESINQGMMSFIVAFILLMIYMCAIYGVIPGMVANAALLMNLFFTLGVLASFQAALTMSGVAGIVLTLGMAVDANVLIYERTKEELAAGKNTRAALADGYRNAFSAIFDSNFTSIITGVILFYFGTGPIRGFATTLIIGLLCSFFTAVFLTRVVYEHFMNKDKWLNLTFVTNFSKNLMIGTKFDFLKMSKSYGIGLAVAIVAILVSFAVRGLSQSIDFTGGRNFVVQFEQQVEPETVREILREKITEDNVQAIALGTDGRTIRITTNYRITDPSENVDAEIEKFLYDAFMEKGLLSKDLTLDTFVDYDNRAGGSIISSQKVGPSIAEDIKDAAIVSVALALVAIFLYILVRFRNVAYSVGSIVALACDVFLIIGCYSLCHGWIPMSLEIDQVFIGAILTAIGYSINDKVVIFDRVREFAYLYPKRDKYTLFNDSLNTTLARTINTSFSTLVVLLAIFILGGDSIRSFSFAMILGVIFGTLSSLFVAAPIAYSIISKGKK
ncbi:MAG: protein translocase subunit SecDF [Bacteroidaceae bacterium]|nr:protein translocase subunit SecDF [Bacteroidaceae bacterium]